MLALMGFMAALLSACEGEAQPTATIAPEMQAATATASAEAADRMLPPCVLDRSTLGTVEAIADTLWRLGAQIEERQPEVARAYFEASIAYGAVAECRRVWDTPVASGTAGVDVAACPYAEDLIGRLHDAWTRGMPMVDRLRLNGIAPADLAPVIEVNTRLREREAELRTACGLDQPVTPGLTGALTEESSR
jgi:hypothetical protein